MILGPTDCVFIEMVNRNEYWIFKTEKPGSATFFTSKKYKNFEVEFEFSKEQFDPIKRQWNLDNNWSRDLHLSEWDDIDQR